MFDGVPLAARIVEVMAGLSEDAHPRYRLTDPAKQGVNSVAFSSGGKSPATADGNESTFLWDIRA